MPFGNDGRKNLLQQIQAAEFAALELNLFLDTHPDNEQALNDYNRYADWLKALKQQYEARYGPLLNFGQEASPHAWHWVDEPWPWEMAH